MNHDAHGMSGYDKIGHELHAPMNAPNPHSLSSTTLQNIWLTLPQDIICRMTWHPNDGTDTCKSEAMWSLFPSPHTPSLPLNRTQRVSSPLKLRSRFMEPHDLRRHLSPPLFSDPQPLPEYLTRSSSDSSAVTVEDTSKDFSSHSAPAPLLVTSLLSNSSPQHRNGFFLFRFCFSILWSELVFRG